MDTTPLKAGTPSMSSSAPTRAVIRIAEALRQTETKATVLIADEAHRTAGLKRKRGKTASEAEKRIRDFTLCHDNDAFPATYRVYQTATPRVYNASKGADRNADYIIRSMDDEEVFGVELYRKSYVEAVNNRWLSDYRIIALAINDPDAYEEANNLARNTQSKGRRKLSSADYMRGLAFALAMGGAAQAARRRRHQDRILHRVHEHRRQVQEHGARPAKRDRQAVGSKVAP